MGKNFDAWNDQKKKINVLNGHMFYHAREAWWCVLGVNIGHEQDGTGTGNRRPVIILKGFSASVCLMVPLTTSRKKNPYHVPAGIIGGKDAFAIISQIRLIDTRRLSKKIQSVEQSIFENIRKSVKDML